VSQEEAADTKPGRINKNNNKREKEITRKIRFCKKTKRSPVWVRSPSLGLGRPAEHLRTGLPFTLLWLLIYVDVG